MEILDQKRTGRTGLGQIQIQIHLGGQGRVGGSRARVDEAERGRKGRARGLRRDAGVLRDAARALAAHPDEQRDRTPEQGDTPAHPRGRRLSRRQVRPDACGCPPEVRRRQRVGLPPLPGRVASQRSVVLTASQKCAKLLTAPKQIYFTFFTISDSIFSI